MKPITSQNVKRITMLVLGESGIGKTSLLRTIKEKTLVISAESGLLCVSDLVSEKKIDGFEIDTFEDLKQIFKLLKSEEYQNKYKWIFIDSLTEIASLCVKQMDLDYPNARDGFKSWKSYTENMTGMIKAFRDMTPYNVVFTCLSVAEKDENHKLYFAPDISGSAFKNRLISYFDEVFHYTKIDINGEMKRAFITDFSDKYKGKDRSGKLNLYEKPDLNNIKTKILG